MKKKITQKELAKELNVRTPTVSDWENGKKIPNLELAHKIAIFFEMHIEEIFFVNNKVTKKSEDEITEKAEEHSRKFINKKKKELQKDISALTFDSEWKENPEIVESVRKKREELDRLALLKKRVGCNRKKVRVTFSDGSSKEYETLTDACKNEHISIHTIRRHLKDGKPDKYDRMYERMDK